MSEKNKTKCGIIYCSAEKAFLTDITEILESKEYDGDLYEGETPCFFTSNSECGWRTNAIVRNATIDNKRDTKNYRIIFRHIFSDVYYVEKNGAINCIDSFLDKYGFEPFDASWKTHYLEAADPASTVTPGNELRIKVQTYLDRKYKRDIIKDLSDSDIDGLVSKEKHQEYISQFESVDNFNWTDTINAYANIPVVKGVLPDYDRATCIEITSNGTQRQSETVYNRCAASTMQSALLDRRLIDGCEFADLYDSVTETFFHVKKRGDLRVLACQVYTGALGLSDPVMCAKYVARLAQTTPQITLIVPTKIKYIIGIIADDKNNITVATKDKLELGRLYHTLTSRGVELAIQFISNRNSASAS